MKVNLPHCLPHGAARSTPNGEACYLVFDDLADVLGCVYYVAYQDKDFDIANDLQHAHPSAEARAACAYAAHRAPVEQRFCAAQVEVCSATARWGHGHTAAGFLACVLGFQHVASCSTCETFRTWQTFGSLMTVGWTCTG